MNKGNEKIIIITKPKLMRLIETLERKFDIHWYAKLMRYISPYLSEEDSYLLAMLLKRQIEHIGDLLFDQEDYWGE